MPDGLLQPPYSAPNFFSSCPGVADASVCRTGSSESLAESASVWATECTLRLAASSGGRCDRQLVSDVRKWGPTGALVDDHLVETIREYYCRQLDEEYIAIARNEPQARPRRITSYLNLLHRNVQQQIDALKSEPFAEGSDILRYFELLPT